MPIQIGQKESDFSDPLGLLSDCHRRIERFLGVLVTVNERSGGALRPDERSALEAALAYFRNAAPKHTADEEDSLFPRLRASDPAGLAVDRLASLEGDHQAAAADHEIVDSLGRTWLSVGALAPDQARDMSAALDRLSRLYARHIAVEDNELFPLAARLLPPEQLSVVGSEMAHRRGL